MAIYVALRREDKDRLIALAQRERRRPADTAALILEEYLRRLSDDVIDAEIVEDRRLLPAPAA